MGIPFHSQKTKPSGNVSDFARMKAQRAQDMASGRARCDTGGGEPKREV